MKKCIIFSLVVVISYFFTACNPGSGDVLPSASGKLGQLILVVEKSKYQGVVGDTLKAILEEVHPMLPQREPLFDVTQINPDNFSNLFKVHRNIVIVNISDSIKGKGNIEIKNNIWASGQMVMRINAPTEKDFLLLISKNRVSVQKHLVEVDRERVRSAYLNMASPEITAYLKNNYHINLAIPSGYQIARKEDSTFVWFRYQTDDLMQSIFVYSRPYTDTSQFSYKKLIAYRDSLLALKVPGPLDSTWMSTYKDIPAVKTPVNYNDNYAVEMRGLWYVVNDFMAGPFVSLSFVDPKNNRLITVEGVVYAPKFDKRNYLRQVEAIVYSMKFS